MLWVELNWLNDPELLRRLGRKPLAAVLDLVAPFLVRQGIALPDPSLPDATYFAEVAALLRSQPIKIAAFLPPFLAETSPAPAVAAPPQAPDQPRYALRRDGKLWHLTFDGRRAILQHQTGICYVAEMFSHPHELVKKLNLVAKYSTSKSGRRSSIEVYDPATGQWDTPAATEPVHEAALAGDDAESRRAYQQRARELLELIRDPTETELAKQEAREELEDITQHLTKETRPHRDPTKAASDLVRNNLDRFLATLLGPGDSDADAALVKRALAEHLQRYLIAPSRRYASPRARKARGELTGCLLYEPPPGVVWSVSK